MERWFDLDAFAIPPHDADGNFFRFGTAGRNLIQTPGLATRDFGARKTVNLHQEVNLEFRAEFFNLFNHPNFGAPDTSVDVPTGGRITTIRGTPRQIQSALRLTF